MYIHKFYFLERKKTSVGTAGYTTDKFPNAG